MGTIAWTRREGPLVPFAEGYRQGLLRQGYTAGSVKAQLKLVGQMNRWLLEKGLTASELTPGRAEEFFAARRALGQRRVPTLRSLVSLFDCLQAEGVVPPLLPPPKTAIDELLDDYHDYLMNERGVTPLTAWRYERMARCFLRQRSLRGGSATGVAGLTAADVTAYLLECKARLTVESTKREAADLRALLRFLYLKGLLDTDLGTAMPPVAAWRDTRLPSVLNGSTVDALLDSCDRSTPSGLRDRAILSLLARLGLRAGEVVALRLPDIDWRAGEIGVHGKGRQYDRLPLPVEVGETLVAYLTKVRPRIECPHVFLTLSAPHRAIHPSSITNVVYRACRRAGLPRFGGHRLRHALASEMLRRGGDLIEIGQVLRHRDLWSTTVYAKVDHSSLRSVARPWPGAEQ